MCEEYCTIRRLLKIYIENWENRVRTYFYKKYCSIKGHTFKDVQTASTPYNGKYLIEQRCKCGESRYIFANTRKPLTDEQMNEYIDIIMWKWLTTETRIYELLPKKPWKLKDE